MSQLKDHMAGNGETVRMFIVHGLLKKSKRNIIIGNRISSLSNGCNNHSDNHLKK